jgi:hypothetical protein
MSWLLSNRWNGERSSARTSGLAALEGVLKAHAARVRGNGAGWRVVR